MIEQDVVLMVVVVMELELIMNCIGFDEEDTLGSSVRSFMVLLMEINLWVH